MHYNTTLLQTVSSVFSTDFAWLKGGHLLRCYLHCHRGEKTGPQDGCEHSLEKVTEGRTLAQKPPGERSDQFKDKLHGATLRAYQAKLST